MIFYAVVTFLIGGVIICRIKSKKFSDFLILFLFILTAFRGEYVGNDTDNYLSYNYQYTRANDYPNIFNLKVFEFTDLGSAVELISNSICRLILDCNLDQRFLLIFYAFISFFFLKRALKSFNANLAYGLAFYIILGYMSHSFNINRQICAACILLYAYSFLLFSGARIYYFFLFVSCAVLIHSFSIFFILIFPLRYVSIKKWEIVVFLLCICFPLVKLDFLNAISELLSIEHVSGFLADYGGQESLITKILSSYIYIFLSFYFYYRWKKCIQSDDGCLGTLYLFSILLYSMLSSYSGVIGRVSLNFSIIECVFLAQYFYRKPLRVNSIDSLVFVMLLVYRAYSNFRMIEPDAPQFYLSL